MSDEPQAPLPAEGAGGEPITQELDSICKVVETAALELGNQLRSIVNGANSFINEMRNNVSALHGDGESSSVSAVLGNQSRSVDTFVGELTTVVQDQGNLTDRIFSISEEVIEAADSVAQISRQSKMLSMNTMIEAARLGEEGRSFVVIAEEMRRLSESIAVSNARISELSKDLAPILENARGNIGEMSEKAQSFSTLTVQHRDEVQEVVEALSNASASTLEAGDRQLEAILKTSNDALVTLQFEDQVSQRLRKVSSEVSNSGENFLLSDSLGNSEDSMGAGEMELF